MFKFKVSRSFSSLPLKQGEGDRLRWWGFNLRIYLVIGYQSLAVLDYFLGHVATPEEEPTIKTTFIKLFTNPSVTDKP